MQVNLPHLKFLKCLHNLLVPFLVLNIQSISLFDNLAPRFHRFPNQQ